MGLEEFLNESKKNAVAEEENLLATEILDFENQIFNQEKTLKELKQKKTESSNKLLNLMLERGVKTWETPNKIKFTAVEPKEPEIKIIRQLNENKLKENAPKIYEECIEEVEKKTNGRKGYLKITLPKE